FSADDSFWRAAGSNPRTRFHEAYWEVAPGEALVVEMTPPKAGGFWSIGLTNFWMESLDFRHFQMNLNSSSAIYNAAGGVTAVIASEDPGVPNWLDTGGHDRGMALCRWNDVDQTPAVPTIRRVRSDSAT
ncbi:MAG TPA: hypothetical protein VH008_00580, partial [Pseudonocardia sp.]|nr:hypothetical protein [Pseudonocardia sp.]